MHPMGRSELHPPELLSADASLLLFTIHKWPGAVTSARESPTCQTRGLVKNQLLHHELRCMAWRFPGGLPFEKKAGQVVPQEPLTSQTRAMKRQGPRELEDFIFG